MELVQQGKDVCTLRNDDTTAYHVAITGDVNKDINVPELLPGQHIQFDLAPPSGRKTGQLHVAWENHLGEKQMLDFSLH